MLQQSRHTKHRKVTSIMKRCSNDFLMWNEQFQDIFLGSSAIPSGIPREPPLPPLGNPPPGNSRDGTGQFARKSIIHTVDARFGYSVAKSILAGTPVPSLLHKLLLGQVRRSDRSMDKHVPENFIEGFLLGCPVELFTEFVRMRPTTAYIVSTKFAFGCWLLEF